MQLAPNLVIANRFRLNRLLGRGGMGSVWHATHLGLDVPCAVKFIEGEGAALPEAHARFEREAKAAAALRSPHVVQILDHGVWEGVPYIAMELLDGEDLGKRIARVGRIPPKELLVIVNQVCRALTKAHALGVVHRDLKPDNIFLVQDDDREVAKVLDFGIAKSAGALDGASTKTGAMLGTPYYMSPEQAQGIKAVDHRSDLWSLAVIVFQALTGRLPFESEALGDLLVKIIVSPIPIPSQFAPDLPPAFDQWWQRATSRDPGQRFQSAKELAESLALVFGVSQSMEPTERGNLRSITNEHGHTQLVPPAAVPTPGQLQTGPRPAFPSGFSPQGQVLTPGNIAPGLVPTPGGPFARTFEGGAAAPPKKRTATYVMLGALGLLIFAGGATGVALLVKPKPGTAASASSQGGPTSEPGDAATLGQNVGGQNTDEQPAANASESAAAPSPTPPVASADPVPEPSSTTSSSTPSAATTAHRPTTNAGGKPLAGGTKPATKPPTTTKKPSGGDLGF